jgi:hypothetical protein
MNNAKFVEIIRCPKCYSELIDFNQKGFGAGKALAGAAVAGGIGLLAGFMGSTKVLATCLSCGKKFNPKEGLINIKINTPSYDDRNITIESNKRKPVAILSKEDIEKKFKAWDRLHEKGLINKDELDNRKQEYLKHKK